MSLIAVGFNLPSAVADLLGDVLLECGALSVNIEDAGEGTAGEKPLFGEPGSEPQLWPECRMSVLFDHKHDIESVVRGAAAALEIDAPRFSLTQIEDIDWVRANREQFRPIRISERMHVVPTWHAATHIAGRDDAINLVLDPGAAFGTGSHPTTRLCLVWLEKTVSSYPHCTLLDYGCGSGILAIAAMKLGARRAVGVDIDHLALDTARFNAAQNAVAVELLSSDDALDMQADIVIANILANPLIVIAPLLAARTRPGGIIALSGVLELQAADVMQAYRRWFDIHLDSRDEDWVCLAGTRN